MTVTPQVIKQGTTKMERVNLLEQTDRVILMAISLDQRRVEVRREWRQEGHVFIINTISAEDADWTDDFRDKYHADKTEILLDGLEDSWLVFLYDIGNKDELWITLYNLEHGGI